MTSREFCYWLQGYFEIEGSQPLSLPPEYGHSLNSEQVKVIKKHLAMVFKHEIDPTYPQKDELNEIHSPIGSNPNGTGNESIIARC